MLACAVTSPAALLAAVMAVLATADYVVLAAVLTRTANIFAAMALWWCLTNGGYTALAFSRVNQYANFMDGVEQTPEMASPLVFDVRRPLHCRGR